MNDIEPEVIHEGGESKISVDKKVRIEIIIEPKITPDEVKLINQIAEATAKLIREIVNGTL